MEKTFTEHTQKTLEQNLSSFQALKDREKELNARLKKAESEQDTVPDKIYQKVRADYEHQLSEISSEIEPLVCEIADSRESTNNELQAMEAELAVIEDEHAEALFRHRVGEFDEAKLKEMEKSILPRIEEKRAQKKPLVELSNRIEQAIESITNSPEPVIPADPEPAEAVKDASLDFDLEENGIEHDPAPFEMEKEEKGVIDDFISELADPDKEHVETAVDDENLMPEIEPVQREAEDTLIPFPNLIITSGSQSGKKIPLLPMTMTIGREHDNNIELKDEDVSRYHARILYHDSHFILEELEGANGTWVNEGQVSRVTLKNSDKIRLGNTKLVIDFS